MDPKEERRKSTPLDRAAAAAVPPNIESAAKAAFRADFPSRNLGGTRLRAVEAGRYVVAVYSPVGGLIPSPYFIYEVASESLAARRLTGDESKPYQIKNYK